MAATMYEEVIKELLAEVVNTATELITALATDLVAASETLEQARLALQAYSTRGPTPPWAREAVLYNEARFDALAGVLRVAFPLDDEMLVARAREVMIA